MRELGKACNSQEEEEDDPHYQAKKNKTRVIELEVSYNAST